MSQPKKPLTGRKLPGVCPAGMHAGPAHFVKLSPLRYSCKASIPAGKDKPTGFITENLPWPLSKDPVLPPRKTAAWGKIALKKRPASLLKAKPPCLGYGLKNEAVPWRPQTIFL